MTPKEFSKTLERISQFWPKFYADQDADAIFEVWFPFFRDDPPVEVNKAVIELVCLLKFPPTIADIKGQMAEDRSKDIPTAMGAFQAISDAVDRSYNRNDAAEQYMRLAPILQKVVGSPAMLLSWRKVSDEAFQTVIMSAIRESYKEHAQQAKKYYAFTAGLQKAEGWRIEGPNLAALPEPEKPKTLDDLEADREKATAEFRERMGMKPNEDYAERLAAFLAPVTEAERKAVEFRDEKRAEKYL